MHKIKEIYGAPLTSSPAAIESIFEHFSARKLPPDYFDYVATGDLGSIGREIALRQLKLRGLDLEDRLIDCGEKIYDRETQDVHAGGSGCGCCAAVFSGWLYHLLRHKKICRLLLVATGALMSPTSCYQRESIPGIAHCISIERKEHTA